MMVVTLHNMCQDRDEPIRSFCARLRGQAGVCKFLIKCPACNTDVNYTDTIIRDVLALGISDPEIQLDLLWDKNQDMTLEEVTQFVEAKDSGKRSASRLQDSQVVQAASSSYKKAKQTAVRDKNEICSYCGKKGHGKSVPACLRKSDCPAYCHKCGYCSREHHFEKVCRSKEKSKTGITTHNTNDCEGAVFDALCSISSHSQQRNGRSSSLRQFVRYLDQKGIETTTICQPCYKNLTGGLRSVWFQHYYKNKYYCNLCYGRYRMSEMPRRYQSHPSTQNELIQVNMKMHAANNKGVTILGATILRISVKDDQGRHVEMRQMTYVTDNSDRSAISII